MRKTMSKSGFSDPGPALHRSGLWLIAGILGAVFLLLHLWNLNARYLEFRWDGIALGNSSHLLWNLAHGLAPATASGAVVAWFQIPAILYLLAPFYKMWPSPLFLLTLQTMALAAAAGAVFFLGFHYLPRVRALILTLFFCVYPPIYGMSSASFHPAILAVPFLTLLILSAVRGNPVRPFCFMACALACDLRTGLLIFPVLVWLALNSGRHRWWAAAALAAAAGLAGQAMVQMREGMGPFIFYGALTAPYLFWALFTLEFWTDRALSKRSIFLTLLSPIFFAGAVFASAWIAPVLLDSHPGVSQLPVRKSAVNALIDQIPADAEVLTTPLFLPRFSNRPNTALLGAEIPAQARSGSPRFALVDLGASAVNGPSDDEALSALRGLVRQGWGPIASAAGVALFSERPGKALQPLYATVNTSVDRPFLVLGAKTQGPMELSGFTMSPDRHDADLIRFSFYWKKIAAGSDDYVVQLAVVDERGATVYSTDRRLCYGLYPFADWKMEETVKDEFLFVVPERLQNSSYEVHLALHRLPDSKPVPMTSPIAGATDLQGRIRLIALDAV